MTAHPGMVNNLPRMLKILFIDSSGHLYRAWTLKFKNLQLLPSSPEICVFAEWCLAVARFSLLRVNHEVTPLSGRLPTGQ